MIDLTKYELKPIYKDNVLDHFGLVPKAEPAKMWRNDESSLQKCDIKQAGGGSNDKDS